jgi:hypothetical protein
VGSTPPRDADARAERRAETPAGARSASRRGRRSRRRERGARDAKTRARDAKTAIERG